MMTNEQIEAAIEIHLSTPNGPVVEYGPDDDAEAVEAEVPSGWSVDWATPAYKLATGRRRSPLVEARGEGREAIEYAEGMITDEMIQGLRREAFKAGDLRQEMICCLALGDTAALEGAEPGTEAAELLDEGRDQEWAREECGRVIAESAARA